MSVDEKTTHRTGRGAAAWGFTFVVLLLISAGMASVPGGDDPVLKARHFYIEHTGVILTAQVIGLAAAVVFVPYARGLRDAWSTSPRASWVAWSGYALVCPRPSWRPS